ncbi:MAG: hydroxymethylpyrimidine/phosphomethylpyrimidine kinase [Flavobacterium sp.]
MPANRPFILTIAGLDPSGGAGILADVKTFEQHRVQGFAINTGNTIQTEDVFSEIQWTDLDFVLRSIRTLFEAYPIQAVKIGIVPSLEYLKAVVLEIKKLSPKTKIVWDTVLKSTTEFNFLDIENQLILNEVLNLVDLITPNSIEAKMLFSEPFFENIPCSILLKGGHLKEKRGIDHLFHNNKIYKFEPTDGSFAPKHGSGCVLSSAITAQLALGQNMVDGCEKAKRYIETFLQSNSTQLGYHHVY